MGTLLGVHFWPSKRLPCANPGALLHIYVPMYIHDQDFNHFLFMCVQTDVWHQLPNMLVWDPLGGPFCPVWRLVCANTGVLLRMYVPMHAHDHNFNHGRCFLCLCVQTSSSYSRVGAEIFIVSHKYLHIYIGLPMYIVSHGIHDLSFGECRCVCAHSFRSLITQL